ncbi:DUF3472 domain-containing protein [Sapientia aquatica]|uniref:DUF3472 domain-containing protein n=1 Tax=Sapientia aquatica TaxID=1549640 RepID=A0A4R5VWJ2_9BURK|nr:DUF3472 domain-containing protein [Sapientia aquatica]
MTLTNSGSSNAVANLNVVLPSGFSASGFNAACGATLSSSSNQVTLTNATVPASGKCVFTFNINIPPVNQLPASNTITIASSNAANSGALAGVAVPSISILGRTPGLYSDTWFPSGVNGVAVLDMFVTPMNDPGPNSNVFWSNQMGGLGGYTGLQSTEIVAGAEGVGKQFLFSLWGATNAQAGTPASAGIGGGSFCTVSGTATDGSAGVQCRYHYDWQAGHTYRFRVTPNASLGGGWFKTNVTDVTGGNVGDSFDIGSIFVGGTATLVPTTYVSQWVEYFDWNSKRTDCTSVPYTSVQFSIQAQSASGSPVNLGAANVYANSSCPSSFATTGFNTSTKTSTEIGAPQASAQGLVKANGSCLTAQQGETAGNPVGSNNAILASCPTSASVHASGGSKFAPQLWVMASDSTIQIENSYCLTAWNGSNNATAGSAGSNVVMLTCAAGSSNQQWTVAPGSAGSAGSQLVLTSSGQCLTPNGSSLTLAACSAANSVWAVPGKSFSY